MGYKLSVGGNDQRGLAPWLVAMTGLACNVVTHDNNLFLGEIAKVKPYEHGGPIFHLLQVDGDGIAVKGGAVEVIRVDNVREVTIW